MVDSGTAIVSVMLGSEFEKVEADSAKAREAADSIARARQADSIARANPRAPRPAGPPQPPARRPGAAARDTTPRPKMSVPVPETYAIIKLGRALQYLTIACNSAECLVALAAGFVAGSIALVGFGFDSAVEVTSSLAALWRLRNDADEGGREAAERRTLRIIGLCFLLLAAYVLGDAAIVLVERRAPDHSRVGIVLAALSMIVMPRLVRSKRRIATRLGSGALEAEARQTQVCAYLSAALLIGLWRA